MRANLASNLIVWSSLLCRCFVSPESSKMGVLKFAELYILLYLAYAIKKFVVKQAGRL